jgi:hypothetical protein
MAQPQLLRGGRVREPGKDQNGTYAGDSPFQKLIPEG